MALTTHNPNSYAIHTQHTQPQRTGGVAHNFNEVRYLLCRLDRAFYERQASGLGDGRPSLAGAGGGSY